MSEGLTYLDCEAIGLHRRVNEEEQRLGKEAFVLRVVQKLLIVRVHSDGSLIDDLASLVEADQALLRVHFAVELKHSLSELCVSDDAAL